MTSKAFEIGEMTVAPGTRASVDLPVSVLSDHTPVHLSVGSSTGAGLALSCSSRRRCMATR